MRKVLAVVVVTLGGAGTARASDLALDAGAVEVLTVSAGSGAAHFGLYPYLGLSLVVPLDKVTLIPGLAVEAAPESGRWGLVASLVADFAVHRRLGLDVDVTVLHDQPGADFGAAEFLVGGGLGFSVFLGRFTVSPYVNLFRDLSVAGWALVPGLNLACAL